MLYGPGYVADGESAIAGLVRTLNQLIDNLTAGQYTPADDSVTDAKVAPAAAIDQSKIRDLVADLAAKADVAALESLQATLTLALAGKQDTIAPGTYIETVGAQTVDGVKTFSSAPVVPAGAFPQAAVANLTTDLAAKATTAAVTVEATARAAADALKTNLVTFLKAQQAKSAAEIVEDFTSLDQWTANANATVVGGRFASTVGGTDADAVFGIYGPPKSARFTFVVKATKSTAGSKSVVGFHVGATPGVVPTGSEGLITFGYLQGTGLVIMKDNIGTTVTLLADASITDGTEYVFSVLFDNSQGVSPTGNCNVRVTLLDGTYVTNTGVAARQDFFPFTNVLVRSNVAAGAIRALNYKGSALGQQTRYGRGAQQYLVDPHASGSGIQFLYRVGPRPIMPPRLVIVCHGHGGTATETGQTSTTYRPTWEAMEKAGFVVAFHDMHYDQWGANLAMTDLSNLYADFVGLYGIDPSVFLFGISMGAGASATAILKGLFPVRAAYMVDGVFDLTWANAQPSFTDILSPAYGGSLAALNANDPMQAPASAYGSVPFYISASAADTLVSKTANSDAFVTKLNTRSGVPATTTRTTTLNHLDVSHFVPTNAPINFFLANL